MKVCFETGGSRGHEVRGIGVHTSELINQFKKNKNYNLQLTNKNDADIVHFIYFKPFEKSLIPFNKPKNQKWILTIHDLIPLIYPVHYPSGIRGSLNFLINKFKIKKNIDAIITISETSKKDICRFLGVNPEKVNVVYLAAKNVFRKIDNRKVLSDIKNKYNLPDNFVLYAGDVNYNKNIPNLIKACHIAKMPLVIVGKQAKEIENMDINHPEHIHLKNLDFKNVIRLGFVSDYDLAVIFNLASVYIQPSLYEGFGLPILEAGSCGTFVIASKTQALVEIMGVKYKYFDPNDPFDIAKNIKNPNKKVVLPRVYSWEKSARDTVEVYEKIFGK